VLFCAVKTLIFTDTHENRSQKKPTAVTAAFVLAIYVSENERKKPTTRTTKQNQGEQR